MPVMPGSEGDLLRPPGPAKRFPRVTHPPYCTGSRPHACESSSSQTPASQRVFPTDRPALTEPGPQSRPRLPKCVHLQRKHSGPTRMSALWLLSNVLPRKQPRAQQHGSQGSGPAQGERRRPPSWPGCLSPTAATLARGLGTWALCGRGSGLACSGISWHGDRPGERGAGPDAGDATGILSQ